MSKALYTHRPNQQTNKPSPLFSSLSILSNILLYHCPQSGPSGNLFDGPKLAMNRFSVELVGSRVEFYRRTIVAMLQSVGVSTEKLTSVLGSSYQKIPGSIQDAHRFSCDTSKHDARRAVAEIVKESATGPGDFLYPVLKVLNEQYLNVDIQSGGELFSYMVGSNDSGKEFAMALKEFSC